MSIVNWFFLAVMIPLVTFATLGVIGNVVNRILEETK